MIIPCNRCKKKIDTPNSDNAHYIREVILKGNKVKQRLLIICKKCKKPKDEVIW